MKQDERDRLRKLRQNTRQQSKRLVARGIIEAKECCERCGERPPPQARINGHVIPGLQKHHPNIEDPYTIEWLCRRCHHAEHGQKYISDLDVAQRSIWRHNAYGLRRVKDSF